MQNIGHENDMRGRRTVEKSRRGQIDNTVCRIGAGAGAFNSGGGVEPAGNEEP